jgi:hypothetical protein
MTSHPDNSNEEKNFGEFRRMAKSAEVLSGSMERLLMSLQFRGRVCVVMQNGRVLKSMMQKKAKVKISKTKTKKAKRESATKGRKSLIPSRCGRILRTW